MRGRRIVERITGRSAVRHRDGRRIYAAPLPLQERVGPESDRIERSRAFADQNSVRSEARCPGAPSRHSNGSGERDRRGLGGGGGRVS